MILSENISALIQNSFCRCLKHVSSVADMQGNVAEKYVYDPAGNILRKTIAGKTTSYTYDKANQLVSSVYDGKTTHYEYDAAGRLIKEGDKSYSYGWLDKVLAVRENDKKIASFDYQVDGQIAQAIHGDQSEAFFWDGLALIHRGETSFINEPYVTGGNPILSSKQGVMFTDMLGSTLNIGGKAIHMTAFGESSDTNAMYTGKPYIGELGYAFLFRNYRADQGKWQTTDPLGYPDGWNNLAYCNNNVLCFADKYGLLVMATYNITRKTLFIRDLTTGISITLFDVVSGNNNVQHQWQYKGPLPIGSYYIVDDLDKDNWWELWYRGDSVLDDTAIGPNGERRGEFRLHPGTVSYGCITVPLSAGTYWQNLIKGTATSEIPDPYAIPIIGNPMRKVFGFLRVEE